MKTTQGNQTTFWVGNIVIHTELSLGGTERLRQSKQSVCYEGQISTIRFDKMEQLTGL